MSLNAADVMAMPSIFSDVSGVEVSSRQQAEKLAEIPELVSTNDFVARV